MTTNWDAFGALRSEAKMSAIARGASPCSVTSDPLQSRMTSSGPNIVYVLPLPVGTREAAEQWRVCGVTETEARGGRT
jgi:hypothetical protein